MLASTLIMPSTRMDFKIDPGRQHEVSGFEIGALLLARPSVAVLSPIRTELHFRGNFRIGVHSPGTRTVGVSPFGLVDERIGDYAQIEVATRYFWNRRLNVHVSDTIR